LREIEFVNEKKPILDKAKPATDLPSSAAPSATRRSARLPIKLPIRIRGIAASGEPFNENTWTLTVSKHGARIATVHNPAVGDIIEIENAVLNLKAEAGVVWTADDRFPREMAVELLEPKEIWGIKFAPLDSAGTELADAPGQGPGRKAAVPSTERAGRASNPSQPTRAGHGKSSLPPAVVKERTEAAGEAGAAAARAEGENMEISVGLSGIELQALAKLEESLTRLEGNEKKAAALERHLNTMQDCLRTSRAELDELLTKFQELQLAWQCEVERAQGSIRDALDKASQHAARDFNQTLQKKGEAVSGQVAEGIRKRLEQEAAALLGNLTKQATGRLSQLKQDCLAGARPELAGLTEQAKSHFVRSVQEQTQAAVRAAEGSLTRSLETWRGKITKEGAEAVQKAQQIFTHRGSLAAEQSEARLRTASGEIEETLRTSSTEHAKRLLAVSHRALGELQEQAKTLVEGARADLAHTLVQFKKKGTDAVLRHLQKSTEDLLEVLTRQLHKHAEDSLDLLREELRAVGAAVRDDLNQQAARGAQETLANLTRKAQEVAREYGAQLENRLQEFRRSSEQLTALTSSSLDASFQPEHPVGTSQDLTSQPTDLSPPPPERAPGGAAARKM
jgi:hypothetical protein